MKNPLDLTMMIKRFFFGISVTSFFQILKTIQWSKVYAPVAVYLCALAFRLVYIQQSNQLSIFSGPTPGLDSDVYWRAAALANAGRDNQQNIELMITTSSFFVWWLAVVQKIFGNSQIVYRTILGFLLSFNAVLIYHIVLFGLKKRSTAFVAGLLFAASPAVFHFETIVAKTNLEISFYLMALLLMCVIQADPSGRRSLALSALLGGVVGLVGLLQQAALALLPLTLLLLAVTKWQTPRKKAHALLILCLVFTAVTVSARVVLARSYPTLPVTGFNLYISYNQESDGVYKRVTDVPGYLFDHVFRSRLKAELVEKKPQTSEEANQYFINEALTYLSHQPLDALQLVLRKIELFFNTAENKCEDFYSFLVERISILKWNPVSFGILFLLSCIGIVYCWRQGHHSFLAACGVIFLNVLIVCLLLMPLWRYRIPAYVALVCLAAAGLEFCKEVFLQRSSLQMKKTIFITVLLTAVSWFVFRSVHSESYLTTTMKVEDLNMRRATGRINWLRGRDITHDFSDIPPTFTQEINHLCKFHFYSYCYEKVSEFVSEGLVDLDVARWFVSYSILFGNYTETADYLKKLAIQSPPIYEHLIGKNFNSDSMNFVMEHFILPKLAPPATD